MESEAPRPKGGASKEPHSKLWDIQRKFFVNTCKGEATLGVVAY